MEVSERAIEKKYFANLKKHISKNYLIGEFYWDKFTETHFETEKFLNKFRAVDTCCDFFDVEHYFAQNVKDIKKINLCRDKFCFNCQSMLAQKRQGRFSPILDELRKDYSVIHMVVTVPNCEGEELLPLLDKMYKKFPFLMRYFKGKAKVKGIDFMQYGYGGAVRGLEVTKNKEDNTYHPHFHCMTLFRKDIDLKGKYINSYSFDKSDPDSKRKFSELEILVQKIWYLLMHDERVTAQAIAELKEGYDVHMSDSEGYYHECFKYACKGAFDEVKGGFIYDELTFWTLFEALDNRRMIQGYGKLHKFNDLDGEALEEYAIAEYERQIRELQAVEKPYIKIERLDEVIEQAERVKYISKYNIKRAVTERMRAERAEK